MSGKIKALLKDGRNSIGKKDPNGEVALLLAGAGVAINHAIVQYNGETRQAIIKPNPDDPQKNKTTINGELLTEERPLVHGDHILFGSHHYFIFCDPNEDPDVMVEWEEAMKEANKDAMMMASDGNNEEVQKQLKEMEAKLQIEKEAKEKEIEEQKKKMEEERQAMYEEMRIKQEEMSSMKNDDMMKKMKEEMDKKQREFDQRLLEQQE